VAVVPPWVLGGTYDLLLRGPGIESESREAVVLDDGVEPGSVIDVALPEGPSGITASLAGETLIAKAVAFAGCDGEAGPIGGRVVRFALPGSASGPLRSGDQREAVVRELDLAAVGERSCEARVVLGPGTATYESDPDAVSVIWEIGNRATAAGRRVRLSRFADAGALLDVTGFDSYGRPCRTGLLVPDRVPPAIAGCGCAAVARRDGGLWRALAAIFCLSHPAAREYDAGRKPLTHGSFFFER